MRLIGLMLRKIVSRPELFFVVTSAFFGTFFAFIIPPFQIPDELVHFSRTYEVSELKIPQSYTVGDTNRLGSMLPKSIIDTYKATGLKQIGGQPDVPQAKKYLFASTAQASNIPLNESERKFIETGSSPRYFPLLYAPQAITIALLKSINSPVIFMLYATRLTGVLVWILLILTAFRFIKTPFRKLSMAAVLLLPMFIGQISASTDHLINGIIAIYVAIIIDLYRKKARPTTFQLTTLVAILSVATLSKPIYVVFGLLLFILPKYVTGLKEMMKSSLLFLVPIIIYSVWGMLTKVKGSYYFDAIAISNADPSSQFSFIFPNVLNFIQPFFNTVFLSWGDGIAHSLIGVFGKLDTPIPLIFVILGYIIIFVATFVGIDDVRHKSNKNDDLKHSKKTIIITSLIILGYFAGVYLAMYIASTPPGEKIITGVQGRYFLALIPFMVLVTTKNWVVFHNNKVHGIFMHVAPIVLLIASQCIIFLRYYLQYP